MRLRAVRWKREFTARERLTALEMIQRNGGRVRAYEVGGAYWRILWEGWP